MSREEQIRKAAYSDKNNLHIQPHPVPGVAEMMNEYFALCFKAGAEWADQHPHWIPIEERLPKENEEVLAYNAENEEVIACDYHHKMFHCWPEAFKESITHWMPLPVPPRKEDNNV